VTATYIDANDDMLRNAVALHESRSRWPKRERRLAIDVNGH
jgi:hypothetical protein